MEEERHEECSSPGPIISLEGVGALAKKIGNMQASTYTGYPSSN